jgi:hypothetical protein
MPSLRRPFVLGGFDEVLPAGPYSVETEGELMAAISFPVYRRDSTLIHLHGNAGIAGLTQTLTIDPKTLDEAIERDHLSAGKWSNNMSDKSLKAATLLLREQEKRRATSDYLRLREAEQEKTTRLRALRLAKEAADRAAADEAATAKTATKNPGSKHREGGAGDRQINKTKGANLSDRGLKHA